MPSVCFTVTKVETNKTVPNPKRDLRRFLGALATFHVSCTVTLAEWHRLIVRAWLLLVWCMAGNCISYSHLPGATTFCVLTCLVLTSAASMLPYNCVFAFFVTLSCRSISKLNKEDNKIIGQNVSKLVLQFFNRLVRQEWALTPAVACGREEHSMGVRSGWTKMI